MDALQLIILTLILAAATVTDLSERRIPNALTYPAMLLALCWHYILTGGDGLLFSAIGLAIGFTTLLIPFLMGHMGAGDVKLMAAVGAFLGPMGVLKAFVFTSLAGGLYAVTVMAWRSPLAEQAAMLMSDSAGFLSRTGRWFCDVRGRAQGAPQLAYGAAIAAGTVISVLVEHGVQAFVPAWWI